MDDLKDKKLYSFYADYIFKHCGIFYNESDFFRLESRLKELCDRFNAQDFEQLHQMLLLNISPQMHTELINVATNNETYFFRDQKPFEALVKSILPDLMKNGSEKKKIWSCGCSTGQEPYTILMSLSEAGFDLNQIDLWATDISTEALAKAKNGVYNSIEIQRGLPVQLLVKYFDQKESNSWQVKDKLKDSVTFQEFNLMKSIYKTGFFDVIFCRNVIIYQTPENKKKILATLFDSLQENGHLFLGSGESLIGTELPFPQYCYNNALSFKKTKEKQAA